MSKKQTIAILKSLLNPTLVQQYLDGGEVVDENYTITPEELVDYPDTLGLFNDLEQRKEYYGIMDRIEMGGQDDWLLIGGSLPTNLFFVEKFSTSVETRKYTMISYMGYFLRAFTNTREESDLYEHFIPHFSIYSHVQIFDPEFKTRDMDFYLSKVNSLWEHIYLQICINTDVGISIFYNGKEPCYKNFLVLGPRIVSDYKRVVKWYSDNPVTLYNGDTELTDIDMMLRITNVIKGYHYQRRNEEYLPINPLTALVIRLSRVRIYLRRLDRNMHLSLSSYLRTKGVEHSVALDNIDLLPVNNLTNTYRNIVDLVNGKTLRIEEGVPVLFD